MPYYKFLHSKDVQKLFNCDGQKNGSILIGNVEYYRLLETITENAWIGDKEDGVGKGHFPKVEITPDNQDSNVIKTLQRESIFSMPNGPEGIHFSMHGCNIEVHSEGFVFSMSEGDLDILRPVMEDTKNFPQPYDACVEILDVDAFREHLRKYGQIDGHPIARSLLGVDWGIVNYTDDSINLLEGQITRSKFRKRKFFESQREYRFFFTPHSKNDADRLIIKFPNPEKFLRIVYQKNDFHEEDQQEDLFVECVKHIEILNTIYKEISAYRADVKDTNANGIFIPREKYFKLVEEQDKKFNQYFKQELFPKIINSYWKLREKSNQLEQQNICKTRCQRMDRIIPDSGFRTQQYHFMKDDLGTYLYGSYYAFTERASDEEIQKSKGVYDHIKNKLCVLCSSAV